MLHAGTVGTVVREDQSSETVSLLRGVVLGLFCLQPRLKRSTGAVTVVVVVVRKEGGRGGGCSRKEHRAALTHLGCQQCSVERAAGRLGFSGWARGRVNKVGEQLATWWCARGSRLGGWGVRLKVGVEAEVVVAAMMVRRGGCLSGDGGGEAGVGVDECLCAWWAAQ